MSKTTDDVADHLPCPFCGNKPVRKIVFNILSVKCPQCVNVGFHNHIYYGCRADAQWNQRHEGGDR